MTTELPPKLLIKRDELFTPINDTTGALRTGFDICAAELLPIIREMLDALEKLSSNTRCGNYPEAAYGYNTQQISIKSLAQVKEKLGGV